MLASLVVALFSAIWLAPAPPSGARVVVLSTSDGDSAGFVSALRIQLVGAGAVEEGPTLEGRGTAENIAQATALVSEGRYSLAVWVEKGVANGGERDYVLYVVGQKQGRALVEVFRLPEAEGAAADRALAIKVREVLDALLFAPAAEPETVSEWVSPEPPPPPVVIAGVSPARAPSWLAELEVRAVVAVPESEVEPSVLAAGGRRWFLGRWSVDAFGGVELGAGLAVESAEGEVETSVSGAVAGARAMTTWSELSFGVSAVGALRRVSGKGTTPQGTTGTESVWIPSIGAAVEVRWPASGRLQGKASLGSEVALVRQFFAVNDQPVADLGRLRPSAALGIAFFF